MKKRVFALLIAMVMVITTIATALGNPNSYLADELTLKLHYNRPDGDYAAWSVWFWEEGGEGKDYPFAEENGDMVATYTVPAGATSIGYIVRTQDWGKDIAEDQFIDVAAYVSGTIHVYVESGVKGEKIELGSDVVTGTKLKSASYEDGQILVEIAYPPADVNGLFTVKGADDEVAIEGITGSNGKYTIKLATELDLAKDYAIVFSGAEYEIIMPDFYSTEEFEKEYTYTGKDLGAVWTKESTTFRVWAPTATAAKVNLYKSGTAGTADLIEQIEMKADVNGTWVATKAGDLNGTYYTYTITRDGADVEACDPYARATGVNGKRAMVIDLDSTDPEGWDKDKNPNAELTINDSIIYELHIRDLGTDENSGIKNVGKFVSLMEHGTKTPGGITTGIDHIKDLGITHLHILPMYDYGSVNEAGSNDQFNWGYDPVNYNVPEGSYSTDPYNGDVRVNEMKQMIQSLHNDGISVVMDVVYNHVYSAKDYCFNLIVPDYFSRVSATGTYSSGSGCGNDTATERAMVKKYIVDSVLYWVEEYHMDGFRFDLVGLIDTETINEIMQEVHKVRPDVIFYGEGWDMFTQLTKEGYTLTTQANSQLVPGFAFFNDTMRDGIKGNIFENTKTGYVSGAPGYTPKIQECFIGLRGWCKTPTQTINYASCHDNMTLFDRLQNSRPDATQEDLIKMNNLAAAIYLTSQGVPFMQAGEEMLRTKVKEDGTFDENSYSSSDAINSLKWGTLEDETYMNVVNYYKGLIAFRKAHGALRLTSAEDVQNHIETIYNLDNNVAAFHITGGINDETAEALYVIFNPNPENTDITLPEGNWNVYVNGEKAGTEILDTVSGSVTVDGITAMVLVQEAGAQVADGGFDNSVKVAIFAALVAAGAGVVTAIRKKKMSK